MVPGILAGGSDSNLQIKIRKPRPVESPWVPNSFQVLPPFSTFRHIDSTVKTLAWKSSCICLYKRVFHCTTVYNYKHFSVKFHIVLAVGQLDLPNVVFFLLSPGFHYADEWGSSQQFAKRRFSILEINRPRPFFPFSMPVTCTGWPATRLNR